jgi:predicted RNase H-like HicB family nuclease
MKILGIIERCESGRYYIYLPPEQNKLNVGVIGEGNTIEEAKTDFKNVLYGFVKLGRVEQQEFEFEFQIDIIDILESYQSLFKLQGLARLTGIPARALSDYITYKRKPTAQTRSKIHKALVELGKNLTQLNAIATY